MDHRYGQMSFPSPQRQATPARNDAQVGWVIDIKWVWCQMSRGLVAASAAQIKRRRVDFVHAAVENAQGDNAEKEQG